MSLQSVVVAPGLRVLVPPLPGVVFTTRLGGRSVPPYDSLNLATATGDDPDVVAANRDDLSRALGIPSAWSMARQVHGCGVLTSSADLGAPDCAGAQADAVIVRGPGRPAAVLVADCVPIALGAPGVAGAVHAGWRGLCAGIVEAAVCEAAPDRGRSVTAWIGPCIGPCCFEVGPEVPAAFAARYPGAPAFSRRVEGSLHFDLRAAAAFVLEASGAVVGGSLDVPCTMCDARFFSHRRDGRKGPTGRQALVTWVAGAGMGGGSGNG